MCACMCVYMCVGSVSSAPDEMKTEIPRATGVCTLQNSQQQGGGGESGHRAVSGLTTGEIKYTKYKYK